MTNLGDWNRQRVLLCIWLLYSDGERSTYLRKHGHGRPWKHPFVVKEVKPHAVLLEIPRDGSVPDVLPWQSLRKCSFAAPYFHDASLQVPDISDLGIPLVPEPEGSGYTGSPEQPVTIGLDDPDGWTTWTSDKEYAIDRVVKAERRGGGWTLLVKWVGYDKPTPEPLSRLLSQTNNPEVLADIERCKQDYWDAHPVERMAYEKEEPTRPEPSRKLPGRSSRPTKFQFAVHGVTDPAVNSVMLMSEMRNFRHSIRESVQALRSVLPDFRGLGCSDFFREVPIR